MDHSYWHKQTSSKPLYPDIEWSKPEQRTKAGRLGIIGGNKSSFVAVADSYSEALSTGIGEAKALLPEAIKKSIPPAMSDVVFAPANTSGSLSRDAINDMLALSEWSSSILMIGDAGRSSETAILYEEFARKYTGPIVITRDAIDIFLNSPEAMVARSNTLLVVSFAQAQKIFRAIYYPKMLLFSMQLTQLVEALHKFTITYPVAIATLHNENLVIAAGGEVTTTPWDNPMAIWRGQVATRAAVYYTWNQGEVLQATTASLLFSK